MGGWDVKFGRGHFENCIRPFKKYQKWMQMIPNINSDTFQPIIDFSYGLDVEIRPKLTPGAGTQVLYSTALWMHGRGDNPEGTHFGCMAMTWLLSRRVQKSLGFLREPYA